MIYRLSTRLGQKIKERPERCYPQHANPYLDWSAHLFVASRVQYIIISNTSTVYSVIIPARGVVDFSDFILTANRSLAEFMDADGLGLIFQRIIVPNSSTSVFSKALNKSVTGYMNEMVYHAKCHLVEDDLSPFETSQRLNEMPLVKKKFFNAREGFRALVV